MDLSNFAVSDKIVIHIEHPKVGKLYKDDDESKPCTITVYGPASERAVEFRRQNSKKLAEKAAKKGAKAVRDLTGEDIENNAIERMVALTADVNNITLDGVPVTPENVVKVYEDPKFGWLRDQVAEKLGDWEAFLE